MSKGQHSLAAAFFLLGGHVESAVRLCVRQMGDMQLGLVLARLHAS